MSSFELAGVIPPLSTPLLADGATVDTARLKVFAQYMIECGVHGLFANGSMGGFPFLTDLEQDRSISTTAEVAEGRLLVMGGVAELATARAVQRARQIARLGVTHLSLLAPMFYFTDQEQLFRHFSEIAAAVDLPLVLYDNPVLTKNPIHPETVLRLRSAIPQLVGIKESNQDCVNLQRLLTLTRDDPGFSVMTGSEYLIVVALQMGVKGTVGGLHNLDPKGAVALYHSFRAGDMARAEAQQQKLIDLAEIFSVAGIWDSFQDAMRFLGLAERVVGAPYLGALTTEQSQRIRSIVGRHISPPLPSMPPISSAGLPASHPSLPIEA